MRVVRHELFNAPSVRVDSAADREPATAVYTRTVQPGRAAEYEALAREMVDESKRFAGHVASTMLHEEGSSTYTLMTASWIDRRSRPGLTLVSDDGSWGEPTHIGRTRARTNADWT
jgi:hypothetical protein